MSILNYLPFTKVTHQIAGRVIRPSETRKKVAMHFEMFMDNVRKHFVSDYLTRREYCFLFNETVEKYRGRLSDRNYEALKGFIANNTKNNLHNYHDPTILPYDLDVMEEDSRYLCCLCMLMTIKFPEAKQNLV